jgi:LysR family transcriptional regulator, transcriptional activator of nhaA
MQWLNYHHLYYFSVVARRGTVARASAELRLSQSAISTQIHQLETALGVKLFVRAGHRLILTDAGETVLGYAEEIFAKGRELVSRVTSGSDSWPTHLVVGVTDALPRPLVTTLLKPLLAHEPPVRLVCRYDSAVERLIAALQARELDILLADRPARSSNRMPLVSKLLAQSGTTLLAAPRLAAACRRGFPSSLKDRPFLLPGQQATLRRDLEQWLGAEGIAPRIMGEFEDSALMYEVGEQGIGVVAGATLVETHLQTHCGLSVVGRIPQLTQRFYATALESRMPHPLVGQIFGYNRAPHLTA